MKPNRNRTLSQLDSVKFNLFIDRMGITNKEIYNAILDEYFDSALNMDAFINICQNSWHLYCTYDILFTYNISMENKYYKTII